MSGNEPGSRDAAHFEQLYAANPDPWNFATSEYERRKYDATIAALADRRFAAGFEIGCSIGILTYRLAAHCDSLLAADIVPSALAEAARRCAALPHVSFARLLVPQDWPAGQKFDLIIFSEVLYFLSPADVRRAAAQACASIQPGGVLLLVNYTDPTGDPCTGDEAAEIFIAAVLKEAVLVHQHRADKFRIDLLEGV